MRIPESDALLTNARFYAAFRERDQQAMEALWARNHGVLCLHPGWAALTARADVISSWDGILSNPNAPEIFVYGESVVNAGPLTFVVCYEVIEGSVLVATNGMVIEEGECRIVSHQSGQCANPPPPPAFQ